MPSKIAVIVDFRIKTGMEAQFEAHIRQHAADTLAEEPGCERFDVLAVTNDDGTRDAGRIMLYELYSGAEAFAAHRANPRMKVVGPRGAAMVEERTLTVCELAASSL